MMSDAHRADANRLQNQINLANLGADGIKKITIAKKKGSDARWKAVRGFWDGGKKRDGTSGWGIVIKGVDGDKWITISKIVVPFAVCSALSARCYVFCLLLSVSVSLRPLWSALVLACEAHVLRSP